MGVLFLQKIVGYQKACELTFTGRRIFAQEALDLGLVIKAVDKELLSKEEVNKLAIEISKKPPNTLRYTKRLLKMGSKIPLEEFFRL